MHTNKDPSHTLSGIVKTTFLLLGIEGNLKQTFPVKLQNRNVTWSQNIVLLAIRECIKHKQEQYFVITY